MIRIFRFEYLAGTARIGTEDYEGKIILFEYVHDIGEFVLFV